MLKMYSYRHMQLSILIDPCGGNSGFTAVDYIYMLCNKYYTKSIEYKRHTLACVCVFV